MHRITRALFAVVLVAGMAPALQGRQRLGPANVTAADLSLEEMETFLLTAAIIKEQRSDKGVTDTVIVTLSDGRITHDAQVQTVDIQRNVFNAGRASEVNFKDTYRFNIGGYRLARMLGMANVPMSVKRRVKGKDAAVTWWIDDYMFDEGGRLKHTPMQGPTPERTSKQYATLLVFDELIQNKDRNPGNLLWTKDWTLWMIDHTRAFRTGKELMRPGELLRCDRRVLETMRALTIEGLTKAMGDVMFKDELNAVIARRDLLVKHFEERIKGVGEPAVLFTM
jgi:hypothetical protein